MNKTDTDYESINFKCEKKSQEGKEWNFKISSWNIVSLKAVTNKNGMEFLKYESPDVMCFQETKCSEKKMPEAAKVPGYHRYFVTGMYHFSIFLKGPIIYFLKNCFVSCVTLA